MFVDINKYMDKCPTCGNEYKGLGQHWRYSPEHRPDLTDNHRNIVTGLMMSDGSLHRGGKNPTIQVAMTNKKYLEWLDNIFGIMSTGVYLSKSSEELHEEMATSEYITVTENSDYDDYWALNTRALPELHDFDWYTGPDDEKIWPKDIEPTPTVLTHLYVGDGYWDNKDAKDHIVISAANERGNEGKINSYFEDAGLPTPSNYSEYQYDDGNWKMDIHFTKGQSHELWDYMDSAPPGFEYKFPKRYR